MKDSRTESAPTAAVEERHVSRFEMVWDVVVFQFKLAFDGIRDLLLVPFSIVSAILGLVAGGDEPDRYFKLLLRFGQQTEAWLNLFGQRDHDETSDKLIQPLQDKLREGARTRPWLNRAGAQLNRGLDSVNATVGTGPAKTPPETNSLPKDAESSSDS
jgi:hypothetical protein